MINLIIVVTIVTITVIVVRFSIRTVSQGEEWIIERLGRYHRTLKPGLAFVIPFLDYIRNKVNVREQFLDVPSQAVITRDNAIVQIDAVFSTGLWIVTTPLTTLQNINASLIQLAKTNLRAIIGSMELEHALSNRDEINAKLRNNLSGIESEWGIVITRVEIKDILPPETIVKAMEKQIQADREKRAIILQAEASREKQRLESEGYLIAQTNRAEAIKRVGQAQADVIAMIGQSLKESGETAGLLQLGERYIEAIKDLASSNSSKLIIFPNSIIDAVKKSYRQMSPFLWILLGILLSLLELAHPVMIFFPIGLSAIATGILGFDRIFYKNTLRKNAHNPAYYLFVVSAINIYLLRKISKEWISIKTPKSSQPENAILGHEVYAKEDAKAKTMIKVESPSPILGVNLWHAKVLDDVKAGDKLIVVGHEGGILVCKKASSD